MFWVAPLTLQIYQTQCWHKGSKCSCCNRPSLTQLCWICTFINQLMDFKGNVFWIFSKLCTSETVNIPILLCPISFLATRVAKWWEYHGYLYLRYFARLVGIILPGLVWVWACWWGVTWIWDISECFLSGPNNILNYRWKPNSNFFLVLWFIYFELWRC